MCSVVEFVGFIAVSYDLLVMCASAFAKHWRSVGQNLWRPWQKKMTDHGCSNARKYFATQTQVDAGFPWFSILGILGFPAWCLAIFPALLALLRFVLCCRSHLYFASSA